MSQVRQKATAFSIAFGGTPQAAATPRPKRSGPFQFLKRDSGARADSIHSGSQTSRNHEHDSNRTQQSLRKAIASDMRNRVHVDHFATDIAVPKRPPPSCVHQEPKNQEHPAVISSRSADDDEPPKMLETQRPVDTTAMDEEAPPDVERQEKENVPTTRGCNEILHQGLRPVRQENELNERASLKLKHRRAEESVDSVSEEEENRHSTNYFRPRPHQTAVNTKVDDDREDLFLQQLHKEVEDCRRERQRYRKLTADAIKEKQAAESLKDQLEEQLQQDRDEFESYVAEEKRMLRRERKTIDEQKRTTAQTMSNEREGNRRLQQEIELLRESIDKMNDDMRERDRAHKAEVDLLRREISDLSQRNKELHESLRKQQLEQLDRQSNNQLHPPQKQSNTDTFEPPTFGHRRSDASDEEETGKSKKLLEARAKRAAALEERQMREEEERRERLEREQRAREERERRAAEQKQRREEEMNRKQKEEDERRAKEQQLQSDRARRAVQPSAAATIPEAGRMINSEDMIDKSDPLPAEDYPNDCVTARNESADGKIEKLFKSGKREILYSNGTRKCVLPSGHVSLYFTNGDVKRTFPSGKSTYWYEEAQTTHTQLSGGIQIFEFHATGQTEKHYVDGTKEIMYPEGIYKIMRPDGSEETIFPDGTTQTS